jgi:hypothetical protein
VGAPCFSCPPGKPLEAGSAILTAKRINRKDTYKTLNSPAVRPSDSGTRTAWTSYRLCRNLHTFSLDAEVVRLHQSWGKKNTVGKEGQRSITEGIESDVGLKMEAALTIRQERDAARAQAAAAQQHGH